MTRIIHYNTPMDDERIFITEDTESDVYDFIPEDCVVHSDETYSIKLPAGFPIDREFDMLI